MKNQIQLALRKMINEAAIKPMDYGAFLDVIKNARFNNLNQLNDAVKEFNIVFKDKSSLKNLTPQMQQAPLLGKISPGDDHISMYVDQHFFFGMLGSQPQRLMAAIKSIIEHESIHVQQIDRSGGKVKDASETDMNDYLSNPQEIMAYAYSFVDHMLSYLSFGQAFNDFRKDYVNHPAYEMYRRIGGDVFKKLRKYMYEYFMQKKVELGIDKPKPKKNVSKKKKLNEMIEQITLKHINEIRK